MTALKTLLAAALLATTSLPASALDAPKGPVILTVTGAITNTNGPNVAEFDLEMLQALEQKTHTQETPWTDGKPTFSGPLGRALLDAVGATGETMTVTALNDYAAEVPVEDFRTFDVILATTMDGQPMSVRDKGPLFIIYPFADRPELHTELYFNRSVWQIAKIDVR